MTRDYKNRTSRRGNPQNKGVPLWRWIVATALLGLFIAFLIFLKNPAPPPQPTPVKLQRPEVKKQGSTVRETKKPAQTEPEKPRFEFYTLLPEQEVEIPETEIKIRKSEEIKGKTKPGSYVLQVGSFRNFKDADRLKAELAMQGIHSNIETAKINGVTWNRVKIGPIKSMSTVDAMRKQLRQKRIDAIVISAK